MQIQQLEYKGLNLMDVVSTVEIAIDAMRNTVHVYDTQQVVEPEYDFVTKGYRLSEGFYKMAGVIQAKPLFLAHKELMLFEWVEAHRWVFYCSKQKIKEYEQGQFHIIHRDQFSSIVQSDTYNQKYYSKYVNRLK
ncbi:aminopeptidase [Solibacillus sp. MA9]|uniref:Aminopeptidase n=1 Tax=Solibacillus palustris TaxID=2908203 RepID=A0ABS9UBJ1_9BACL|nr:aminopeptidase [Solibacillus sp. MA9]MCH7321710.1 aminopeptidase [Solibacillus sp. MA9]